MSGKFHKIYKEHVHDGMVLNGAYTPEVLDHVKDFQFQGDVLVASYPKTGTTWLQEVTWLVVHDADTAAANQSETFNRIPYLEYIDVETKKPMMDVVSSSPRPLTIKTHLPVRYFQRHLREDDVKILVIVRNPKDTLVSFYHFYQSHEYLNFFKGSFDEFFDMFKEKHLLYGDFFDWYRDWWAARDHEKVLFLKYEDMKEDLPREIRRVASFLGKELTDEKVQKIAAHVDFDSMKNNKMTNWSTVPDTNFRHDVAPFIRQGKSGTWRSLFTQEQSDFVDKLYESELKQNGLELNFG